MSKTDDIYLQYVEEVDYLIKKNNPKNREEVYEIVDQFKNEVIDEIESALDEIAWDYCEINHIYDEEE